VDTTWPDLSEHQEKADIAGLRKQTEAVAFRVSYGTTLDNQMPFRLNEIRDQGFVVVLAYLFLRSNEDVGAQVNAVTNCLGDLRPGESVVIDFEKDGTMPTVAQRDEAAGLFEARYHRPTVIYDSASVDTADPTARPVWVASYGCSSEPQAPHVFWQYSNGTVTSAGLPMPEWAGCGRSDTNIFHGTAAQLALALGSATSTPQGDEDMSDALTIVYPTGAKRVGTPDGAIKDAGTTPYGSFYSLRPDERQVLTWPLTNFFALTPVDINNEAAGSIGWCIGTDNQVHEFRFDAAFLASHS
jgi:hypothetical protein